MKVSIENHGSICLVRPQDAEAVEHLATASYASEPQFFGNALVVEPRYVGDFIEAFCEYGEIV